MCPSLRFELKLLIITGYEHTPEFRIGDVAYQLHTFNLLDFLVIADGNGKQQLVVLASVQGTGGNIHVQLLSHHCRLVIDGDVFLENTATHTRLLTDVKQFGRETIADVHHRCRTDTRLTQFFDDISTGLSLELPLQQIFLAAEIGLEVSQRLASST